MKTIDLAKVDEMHETSMTDEEWRAELAKPRAERRGLSSMPEDMSITGADAERFTSSILKKCKQNK